MIAANLIVGLPYTADMWRTVPDSIDRFPGDFVASLRVGAVAAVVLGVVSWWLARQYMLRTYPGHVELLGAAAVVGVLDGTLLGIAVFVLTYVVRVFRYERRLRKASDTALRTTLEAMTAASERADTDRHRPL